jgi:deoxyribodipyrimidine photo-lyase
LIQRERVRPLNNEAERSRDYVLYWMQASQRAEDNHALEYAVGEANARGKPLVVFFGLTDKFPEANEWHYAFMLEGLREVARTLEARGIRFVVRSKSPEIGAAEMARCACLVVVDRGYLRIERQWRATVALEVLQSRNPADAPGFRQGEGHDSFRPDPEIRRRCLRQKI